MTGKRSGVAFGFGLFCAAAVAAGDVAGGGEHWPHWRGPLANGVSPTADPPITWDGPSGRNIKWKAEVPGRGSSSPIVWGDQVFVLTAIKTDREAAPAELPQPDPRFKSRATPPTHFYRFVALSYDRATGAKRWERLVAEAVPHEGLHETNTYASGSPTTDGKRLYASFGSFGTAAYTLDGTEVWRRDFGRMHTRNGFGDSVTPVVYGKYLLLNRDQEADSKLVCLDAATGATVWEAARDEVTSWNTPLVVEHNGTTQVVVNGTKRVRGHDLATGKELWSVGGMTVNAIPSPVADGGIAYIFSGNRAAAGVAVPLDAAGDLTDSPGKLVWRHNKGTPFVPSPVLLDGRLYFTKANEGTLTVLDAKTGKPVIDQERLPDLASVYASPVSAAGRVYVTDRQGTTVVLKAGADEVEVLAANKLDDRVDATPAIAGRELFLRGAEYLYCITQE